MGKVETHFFLTSTIFGGEWLEYAPTALPLRERASITHCTGRLGGPQSRSGHCREEKNLLPLSEIESQFFGRPVRGPSLSVLCTYRKLFICFCSFMNKFSKYFAICSHTFRMRLHQTLSTHQYSGWIKLYFK
jgi:hypothetical protein